MSRDQGSLTTNWRKSCFPVFGTPTRTTEYNGCSAMNRKHQLFAWLSLFWVAFTDVYVRLCSMGIWTDFRIL